MQIKKTETAVIIDGRRKKSEMFTLIPDKGQAIRNKLTGKIITNFIVVSPESEVSNYEDFNN